MTVKMYKSKSELRYEDEHKPKEAPKVMPSENMNNGMPPTSTNPEKTTFANFTENINTGLGIGGTNVPTHPSSMDQSRPLMLSKRDLENMLEEI